MTSRASQHIELLSEYDFKICTTSEQIKQALALRMTVFHKEQGFPADTEIDEYDKVSAHFILTQRSSGLVAGTVRVTPYPRRHLLSQEGGKYAKSESQDDGSLVHSGGGPSGTSGALPMTSGTDGQDAPATKTEGTPAHASDDAQASRDFPFGRLRPHHELAEMFLSSLKSKKSIFEEEHDAPEVYGAKISRLAINKSARGRQLGALIMRQVEGWLLGIYRNLSTSTSNAASTITVVISSQIGVRQFYEKFGYSVYGEPYDEEGAPHCWCLKSLSLEAIASPQQTVTQ